MCGLSVIIIDAKINNDINILETCFSYLMSLTVLRFKGEVDTLLLSY